MHHNTQRNRKPTTFHLLFLSALVITLLTACGAQQQPAQQPAPQVVVQPTGDRVVMVIHGDLSKSPFWQKVEQGARQGEKDTGLKLEIYDAGNDFDKMTTLIGNAVTSDPKPVGMIISLPDINKLRSAVDQIVAAGIPFIVINAGLDDARDLGAITAIGQNDYEAGRAAGERMTDAGVRHAFCLNLRPDVKNLRCEGFSDAMQLNGGEVETLVVNKFDPEAMNRIIMALQSTPDVDGMLSTADLPVALDAIQQAALQHEVKFGSFDYSQASLEAIQRGDMLFAIDQWEYMQGYYPMIFMHLYLSDYNKVYASQIATGPRFISKENVEEYLDLINAGAD